MILIKGEIIQRMFTDAHSGRLNVHVDKEGIVKKVTNG